MKKKANKLLASFTAAAMAVMCTVVALPKIEVSAAAPLHTIEWSWSGTNELLEGIDDAAAVKKAVVNMQYASGTNEYANGKVTSNSNGTDGTDGWKEVTYGTGSQTFQLTAGTAADVEIEVVGVTDWIQIGVSEYGGGNLTINSVKLLDENGDALATKTVGKSLGTPYSGGNDNLTGWDETKAATIKKISANLQYAEGTNEYANGKLTANSDGGWKEVTFGTGSQTFQLTAGTAADVELEVTGITNWLQFGVVEYGGGGLTINSVKFLDESGETVYELPASATPPEPDEPDEPSGDVEVVPPANTTGTTVTVNDSAIKGAVTVTDAEKAQGVTLNLKIDNAVLDTAATEAVNNAASDRGITASNTVLDIKLVKTVGGTESDVTTLAKPLPITIDIPAALVNNDSTKTREYFVIHYHDGEADIIGGTFANGKFTFGVDGFSAFVLAYKDTPKASGGTSFTSSANITADGWGTLEGDALPLSALIGDLDPSTVKTITFEGQMLYQVGFNGKAADGWTSKEAENGKIVLDFSDVKTDENYYFQIGVNGTTTVTWTATTEGGSAPVDPKPDDPKPEDPKPAAKPTYSVYVSGVATVKGDYTEGAEMTVEVPFGMTARVYSGNVLIATIYNSGTFVMPANSVTVTVADESGAGMMAYNAPNSYIFSYDSSMKLIKTTRSKKGIRGTGEMTVNLGASYAGKSVTLYSGKNSNSNKLEEAVLDSKGCATFTVEAAKNYSLVVED